MRTLIDILKKGNQELFHSAMIAWLFDPLAEHGYGPAILHYLADLLKERNWPQLYTALAGATLHSVKTETTGPGSRYDIDIHIGNTRFVFENKTKSLGGEPQFQQYKDTATLIALGLCDISFSSAVRNQYPLLTYKDVLGALDMLPQHPTNDFAVLVDHYRRYLRRELCILDTIDKCFGQGCIEEHDRLLSLLAESGAYNRNDFRFLNLYLFQRFLEGLSQGPGWCTDGWKTSKDQQGDVWLAVDCDSDKRRFRFRPELSDLSKAFDGGMWFHVVLWDSAPTMQLDNVAGSIQCNCWNNKKENKEFARRFRELYKCRDNEAYCKYPKDKDDTFALVSHPLTKRMFVFRQLETELASFAAGFCCP